MNPLVKAAWIRLVKENPKVPPYYLLNKYYEEATGSKIFVKNKYALRDGAKTAPKYLEINTTDLIQPCVAKWAGLDSTQPQLPSYSSEEFGGCGLRNKSYKTVNMVWEFGIFRVTPEINATGFVKMREEIPIFCKLMEKDL